MRACASPGRCWTIGGGRAIRREQAGGTGEVEWVASDEPAHADGCWVGSLPRPVAITVPTGGQPVVAVGEAGVVVRDDEGAWEQVAVLDAEPPVPAQPQAYSWAVLLMAPVLAVLVIALRPLLPRWPWALLVVAIGSAATFLMEFAVMFLVLERRADVFVVFGLVATAVASIAVGRSGAHPSPPVGPPLRPG